MVKPTPKKEVAVSWYCDGGGIKAIYFYSTTDALPDFVSFGKITEWTSQDYYQLKVDPRFDFKEVLEYIQRYGE